MDNLGFSVKNKLENYRNTYRNRIENKTTLELVSKRCDVLKR